MLSIGEFSGPTGLSVKALRHYDEKGILVPVEVDERSGYRRYGEQQVRDGAVVRALRDAGVPLPSVVTDSQAAREALAFHRATVNVQRIREDAAFDDADTVLRALATPVEVTRRHCPAQAFVGRVLSIPVTDAEALTDDDVSDAGSDLIEQLHASGVSPSGPFWMALRGGGHDRIELMCCWPVAQALPEGWGGDDVVHGHLPKRVELVASWHATPTDSIPENATHPAVVALFDEMADHSIDLSRSEVRQTMLGTDEFNCIVEVAITVEQQ